MPIASITNPVDAISPASSTTVVFRPVGSAAATPTTANVTACTTTNRRTGAHSAAGWIPALSGIGADSAAATCTRCSSGISTSTSGRSAGPGPAVTAMATAPIRIAAAGVAGSNGTTSANRKMNPSAIPSTPLPASAAAAPTPASSRITRGTHPGQPPPSSTPLSGSVLSFSGAVIVDPPAVDPGHHRHAPAAQRGQPYLVLAADHLRHRRTPPAVRIRRERSGQHVHREHHAAPAGGVHGLLDDRVV